MNTAPQFRFKMVHAAVLGLMLVTLPVFQNCSNVGFDASSSSKDANNGQGGNGGDGNSNQNTCNNDELQTITTPVKVLLVVDTSGSNAGSNGTGGTDPGKTMRAGSIQAFFNDFGGKPNFNWGLITFQGSSASAILNYNNNVSMPAFTSDSATMQAGINYFKTVSDAGQTPYQAALQLVHTAIVNDTADTAQTKYIVVFLSDGLPTDYPNTTAGDNQINADVSSLVGLKPGRLSFNTVYYGPADAGASGRLHNMANAGQGQFLDTNANPNAKDFLINNVVTVPGGGCPSN